MKINETRATIRRPRREPPVRLGPFKTRAGTVFFAHIEVVEKPPSVKSFRLTASHLPTDPESISILLNEDYIIGII